MKSRNRIPLHLAAWAALTVGSAAHAHSPPTLPPGCEFLADFHAIKGARPDSFASITDYNAFMARYRIAEEQSAKAFYTAYRTGQATESRLAECLPNASEREGFDEILPRVFLTSSLAELRTHPGQETSRFLDIVEDRKARGLLNAFRLVAHHDESNPTGNLGGFHRANRSIFMDLGKIRGTQWLLVLAHELAHAVDTDLAAALPVYNHDATVAQIAQWGHQFNAPTELSTGDLAVLDQWLLAGMNRGVLTEARAWAITVAIYREGLQSSLFSSVDWMESHFSSIQSPSDTLMPTFSILSPRFVDPSDGLFSLPLVQTRLKWLRQALLQGSVPFSGIR